MNSKLSLNNLNPGIDEPDPTLLVLLSFHLHLLADLVGARGPDGEQWPIPYFLPFVKDVQLTWSGQWALNAWPNFVATAVMIAIAFILV